MITVPCTAAEALKRARDVAYQGGQYLLGTGDYWPHSEGGSFVDLPWTSKAGVWGSDCAGFAICYAWKLTRHRPGFNKGTWATVSDDINSDSALQDARYKQELFVEVTAPRPGDLLIYPSIYIKGKRFIGHVGLVESVPAVWTVGEYNKLGILQCHGPNGFRPGVVRSDGSTWTKHDVVWPKEAHRSALVRPKERIS